MLLRCSWTLLHFACPVKNNTRKWYFLLGMELQGTILSPLRPLDLLQGGTAIAGNVAMVVVCQTYVSQELHFSRHIHEHVCLGDN
jgi:hypothetical protein